jgi:hypothetical protein
MDGIRLNYFTTQGIGVCWTGSQFIATGQGGNSIAYSYDGINWTPTTNSSTIFTTRGSGIGSKNTMVHSITFKRNVLVAVGQGGNSFAYSYDGITWTGKTTAAFTNGYDVVYNGKLWVATSSNATGNTISYSNDYLNWIGLGANIFTATGYSVAWNGTLWVAGGQGGNTLAYSYDGATWMTSSTANILAATGGGQSVIWSGTIWVASGGNSGGTTIAYSYDGINWASSLTTGNTRSAVATNGYLFLAGGADNILNYSYDGINWSVITQSVNPIGAIKWVNNMWVITGGSATTYSYDGLNWISGTNIYNTQGLSLSYNGTVW